MRAAIFTLCLEGVEFNSATGTLLVGLAGDDIYSRQLVCASRNPPK